MKILPNILFGLSSVALLSQTNNFPDDGKVGIGTLSPQAKLQVNAQGTIGSVWNPSASYFTLSDGGGQKIIMDTNEIYGSHTLHLGSNTGDVVKFRSVFTSGSAKDWMIIKEDGKVGIGTTSPQGLLDLSSGGTGDAILRLEADLFNNNETYNPLIQMRQDGGIIGADIGFSENFGDNRFGISPWHSQNGGNIWDVFVIDIATGNIGMGTQNPGTWKLAVKGKIRAEEIKVETGWADYVFKEGYRLPSLEEVERHIKEKGHLINIPSAKQVEENGIELGEMNKLLLEKIEELTLHVIRQEKKIKELERKMVAHK